MDDQAVIRTYGNTDLPEGTEDRPLVTFALFAYNQEKYIREAVEGAFSQTYSPLEIILSDDCSSDRTFEIIEEMAAAYRGPHRVLARRNAENSGWANHINRVLDIAIGEVITWSAGDDIAAADRTELFLEAMGKDPKPSYVHSALEIIDESGLHLGYRIHADEVCHPTMLGAIHGRSRIVTQSCAFRRSAFIKFGPLLSTVTHEAMVMGFRASFFDVSYISKPLTKYRVGSGVSTYRGKDLQRLKVAEPLKTAGWHKSSLEQMIQDLSPAQGDELKILRDVAQRRLEYWNIVYEINSGDEIWRSILSALSKRLFGRELVRAILRIASPKWLYSATRVAKKS